MRTKRRCLWLCVACALLTSGATPARAAVESVLHAFRTFPNGANPRGTLVRDSNRNLYGTTQFGGAANLGTVFKLSPFGQYTVLYTFKGGTDGAQPWAGVTLDSVGNLYGTTYVGGPANQGVVYKLDISGNEAVLYSFTGGADGGNPYAGVIVDSASNLYGTTYNGGVNNMGVVFKVDPSGNETVLHSFPISTSDGANPYGGVTADAAGSLYGTTQFGGKYGTGTVYKLDPSGRETVLYAFTNTGSSGGAPQSGVMFDAAGNLYGTAANVIYELEANGTYKVLYYFHNLPSFLGNPTIVALDAAGNLYGTSVCPTNDQCRPRYGVVFKLDTSGAFTELFSFAGGTNGEFPYGGVILDPTGNLYGTAFNGGVANGGTIYQLTTSGQETTLFRFSPATGGTTPRAGLIRDLAGNLYGTTFWGGAENKGVVFEIDPSGRETVLHSFRGGADGSAPTGDLALDSAGNLYGTTGSGGTSDHGTVYKVSPSGAETVLYSFTGKADGAGPVGITLDAAGNLYGPTAGGGSGSKTGLQEGVVFKLDPAGQLTVLYSFTGLSDGGDPQAGVILDPAGNLYGTTFYGGLGAGVVYEVDTNGHETVLYTFTGGTDGGYPRSTLTRDAAGNL